MTKMHYVDTNAGARIISDDGDTRRMFSSYDMHQCGIAPAKSEEEAVAILASIEDDSGWDAYAEPVEDLLDGGEIIAVLEKQI